MPPSLATGMGSAAKASGAAASSPARTHRTARLGLDMAGLPAPWKGRPRGRASRRRNTPVARGLQGTGLQESLQVAEALRASVRPDLQQPQRVGRAVVLHVVAAGEHHPFAEIQVAT